MQRWRLLVPIAASGLGAALLIVVGTFIVVCSGLIGGSGRGGELRSTI